MSVKLSVIVPCYNVAQYLERFFACLDKQWGERTDYEVVFVNDGSTDRTQALLEQYVAADSRHRVLVSQDNQGVSAARNAGMKVARGEWIAFADPDDLLAEGGYSLLMSKCLDDSIDVLSFKFKQIGENESLQPTRPLSTEVIWEGTTYDRAELLLQSVWYCIYSKYFAIFHYTRIKKCETEIIRYFYDIFGYSRTCNSIFIRLLLNWECFCK